MKKDEDMARPGMRHTMMMRFRKVLHSDYYEKGTCHKALILESIISFFSSKESLLGRQGISKAVRYLKIPFCCTGNCCIPCGRPPCLRLNVPS